MTNWYNCYYPLSRCSRRLTTALLGLFVSISLVPPVHAGPGHDHSESTPTVTTPTSPRFSTTGEHFEVVGIVKDRMIEIYIDDAQTNAPVDVSSLKLELNGQAVAVEQHALGEYDALVPEGLGHEYPGQPVAVALLISAMSRTELLAAELELPANAQSADHGHGHEDHEHGHEHEGHEHEGHEHEGHEHEGHEHEGHEHGHGHEHWPVAWMVGIGLFSLLVLALIARQIRKRNHARNTTGGLS